MKKRIASLLVLVVALVLSAVPMVVAHAYPPCGPYDFPSDAWFCRPWFIVGNEIVLVQDTVSSASIRNSPLSDSPVVAVVGPDTYLQLFGGSSSWDGRQWWWSVQRDGRTTGWIEQAVIDGAALTTTHLPVPCIVEKPDVYLLFNGQRHLIPDWQTFLNLGYLTPDISPCSNGANFPLGAPVTRLAKGSDTAIYWMENGTRRHIPDLNTFVALGFHAADVSVLPDLMLNLWPLGKPLPTRQLAPAKEPSASATATQCVASYSGQITLAFANSTDNVIWINGLDANCHEYHMWSVVKHTQTILLTLPPQMATIRIRDDSSNKLLAQYTLSAAMNGTTLSVP